MGPGLIALSVLATSCWTSASAPPSSRSTETPAPPSSERALASQLADDLRDPEDSMFVEHFIDRQFVVLDLETQTIQVLCDAQTLTAAVRFSELLNDPDRPPATCTASFPGVTCKQGTGSDLVWLDFVRVDGDWRLLGGILPRGPMRTAGPRALVTDYRARLGVSACPP